MVLIPLSSSSRSTSSISRTLWCSLTSHPRVCSILARRREWVTRRCWSIWRATNSHKSLWVVGKHQTSSALHKCLYLLRNPSRSITTLTTTSTISMWDPSRMTILLQRWVSTISLNSKEVKGNHQLTIRNNPSILLQVKWMREQTRLRSKLFPINIQT